MPEGSGAAPGRRPAASRGLGPAFTRRLLLRAGSYALLLPAAAACSGRPPPARPRPTVTLTTWLRDGTSYPAQLRGRASAGKQQPVPIDIFYEDLPAPSATDVVGELARRAAGGAAPDVALVGSQDVARAAHRGLALPLDRFARAERFPLKRFMPVALAESYSLDGALSALPAFVEAEVLFWSEAALREAGFDYRQAGLDPERPSATWEQLRLLATALARLPARGQRGRAGLLPNMVSATTTFWAWQNGGAWLSADARRATFDDPRNVDALEWLMLVARGAGGWPLLEAGTKAHRAVAEDAAPPWSHPLVSGAAAMVFASSHLLSMLAQPDPLPEVRLCQPPVRETGALPYSLVTGYSLVLPPAGDGGVDPVRWEALRFLVGEEAVRAGHAGAARTAAAHGQRYVATWTGQLVLDNEVLGEHATGLERVDKANRFALEVLRHCRWRERNPAGSELWRPLQETQEATLAGQATPAAALREASTAAQRLLDSAWAADPERRRR